MVCCCSDPLKIEIKVNYSFPRLTEYSSMVNFYNSECELIEKQNIGEFKCQIEVLCYIRTLEGVTVDVYYTDELVNGYRLMEGRCESFDTGIPGIGEAIREYKQSYNFKKREFVKHYDNISFHEVVRFSHANTPSGQQHSIHAHTKQGLVLDSQEDVFDDAIAYMIEKGYTKPA